MATALNISKPCRYIESGLFQDARTNWIHSYREHKDNWGIIAVIKGALFLNIDGLSYRINENDVCVLPSNCCYLGNHENTLDVSFYWFGFVPRPSDSPKNICLPLILQNSDMERIAFISRQLLDISNSGYYSSYCMDYTLTSLAIEIAEQYKKRNEAFLSNRHSFDIEPVKYWINSNICTHITMDMLSRKFSINPDYLTRLFNTQLGVGVNKYINIQKISTAKKLLHTTNMSIKEISHSLSIKDEKYFMRLFKKIEGITISQYRNTYTKVYMNNDRVDGTWNRMETLK